MTKKTTAKVTVSFVCCDCARCTLHIEKLDIPESITKKDMVLILRHWQPAFRASVLGPPVEMIVSKKFTTGKLLAEVLKPASSLTPNKPKDEEDADTTAENMDTGEKAELDDTDYELAKWSEFYGNLNGSSRNRTIRKLKFASIVLTYDNTQYLTAAPLSYREGCVLVWRRRSAQVSHFVVFPDTWVNHSTNCSRLCR